MKFFVLCGVKMVGLQKKFELDHSLGVKELMPLMLACKWQESVLHKHSTLDLWDLTICAPQVPSEEAVFEAVLSWVKHDEKKRKQHLFSMLEHVRLPLLTPSYLTDTVDGEVRLLCKGDIV